jgi:diguanylate cyclase (GGDEF)-like protein/PAS domain S-box-containing protein
MDIINNLSAFQSFMSHGYCLSWSPFLLRLHIFSDLLIALAYFSIPLMLIYFLRKRPDFEYRKLAYLTSVFIIACGITHLLALLTIWWPVYWLEGLFKGITAVLSVITAVMMWNIIPDVLSYNSRLKTSQHQHARILESMANGVVLADKNRRLTFVNKAFEQLTGYSSFEMLGEFCNRLQGEQTDPAQVQRIREALAKQQTFHGELINYRKDGRLFWNKLTISPIFDNQGQLIQFVGVLTDITEHKNLEAELINSERRFRDLADTTPALIWLAGLDKQGIWVNKTCLDFTGRTMEQELGYGWAESLYPDDIEYCLSTYSSYFDQRLPFRMEYRFRRFDGEYRWLDNVGVPRFNANGEFEGYIGSCVDITEVRNSKAANDFFNVSHEIIYTADLDGFILDVNQRLIDISGYSRQELIGHHSRILKSGLHSQDYYANIWQSLEDKDYWTGEITNSKKSGEIYSTLSTFMTIRGHNGLPLRYLVVASDISDAVERRQQLEHLVYYDSLTGLPNRLLMMDRLEQAISRVNRHGGHVSVAFLDLDGFKDINDSYGHEVGDEFLIAISQQMKQELRETDTLVRLGGDEFLVILPEHHSQTFVETPILNLLKACATPINLKGLQLKISASIGISFYADNGQYQNLAADALIRQADQAMYVAKKAGKNRYHCYDNITDALISTRYETMERIRHALDNGEFVLYYQPKVNMRSGELVGLEALLRWQHPMRGILSPDEFLPIIENHPLRIEIGQWVLRSALAQLNQWQHLGENLSVSINVDARQLNQHNFLDNLKTLLAEFPDFQAGSLELEILETTVIYDRQYANKIIAECEKLGVEFALDDFGTGYSSLTYLRQLSVKRIKIDRSFVNDMDKNSEDLAIVESVINLVLTLGRQVVAEGIETIQQGEMLLKMGCELGQGFVIAKPMMASEIPAWRSVWKPYQAWIASPPGSRVLVSSDQDV